MIDEKNNRGKVLGLVAMLAFLVITGVALGIRFGQTHKPNLENRWFHLRPGAPG